MMADERMKPDGELPFDGKRLVYAGFEVSFDTGGGGRFGYVNGMIASVPDGKRQDFVDPVAKTARLFQENSAALGESVGRRRACRQDNRLPARRAGKDGETVIFG